MGERRVISRDALRAERKEVEPHKIIRESGQLARRSDTVVVTKDCLSRV